MEVGSWEQVEAEGPYTQFKLADPPINLYVLVLEASTVEESFSQAFEIAGQEEFVIESYADVEAMVQEQVDRLAGSVSIAVLHRGEIVYTYVYDEANPAAGIPADTNTIYAFGSMTKPFTASALMQLVEQGYHPGASCEVHPVRLYISCKCI